MSFSVLGKVALVTGANRGIGRAIVDGLVAAGASKIYAAVRDTAKAQPLVDDHGDIIVPLVLDLNDPASIPVAAATASDVELVINNAGILRTSGPLQEDAIENFRDELEVNVFGLMRMAQAFAPVLAANGGGAFVQLNSVASLRAFADFGTYCASKAAAYSITLSLREVLGAQGTQVLSVHPGPIKTDMGHTAGFDDIADSPVKVADGIIASLAAGEFHNFPDTMALQVGAAYASFAATLEPQPAGA